MATKPEHNNAEPFDARNVLVLAAQDFVCFCVAIHPAFQFARHTLLLIDRPEAIERAQSGVTGAVRRLLSRNLRLAISEPPRHGAVIRKFCPAFRPQHRMDRRQIPAGQRESAAPFPPRERL